jgi:transposase
MTREEQIKRANALRKGGATYAVIATRLGVSGRTAWELVNDPDRSLARARARKGRCVDCGAPIAGMERCAECRARHDHDTRRWTPQTIIAALQRAAGEANGSGLRASDWLAGERPEWAPPLKAVRREFGTWLAALRAAGLHPVYDGYDDDLCLEIAKRWEDGEEIADLAEEYDCARATIVYRIRKGQELAAA